MADNFDPTTYNSNIAPTWCPGCGNFGIWGALKNALAKQNLGKDSVLLTYDIGCGGNMADFLQAYGIHTLHGRTIPVAIGAHLAHHKFPVVAIGGDGGVYGEGIEHLIKAARANFNITVLVCNNGLFSLTTGQNAPTTVKGTKTKTTPEGVIELPVEALKTTILHQAAYVARGYSGDVGYLSQLITLGMQTEGFALIEVLQPCITYDEERTFKWYQQRVYKLDSFEGLSPDEAFVKLDEGPDKMVTGVLYRSKRPAYHTQLPQLQDQTLLEQPIDQIDITDLINNLK